MYLNVLNHNKTQLKNKNAPYGATSSRLADTLALSRQRIIQRKNSPMLNKQAWDCSFYHIKPLQKQNTREQKGHNPKYQQKIYTEMLT